MRTNRLGLSFRIAGFACVAALLSGCRQEMADQPILQPLKENTFFADDRASRPLIDQTVARGHLKTTDFMFTGKVNGALADGFPFTVTEEVLNRGMNRFNIYCMPCHGSLGNGKGMIVQRGLVQPASFHDDRLVNSPSGYFYDVITNGFGRMQSYAEPIEVRDRWAIVAYVRALQASRRMPLESLPADIREKLAKSGFAEGPGQVAAEAATTATTVATNHSTGAAH